MIRLAIPDDVHHMVDIYNQAIADRLHSNCDIPHRNPDRFLDIYFSDNSRYTVIVSEQNAGGSISGWAALKKFSARPYDPEIAEVTVYVRRENRSSGIGIRMLRALIEYARKNRFKSLVAIILGKNVSSIRGSMFCGFEERVRFQRIANIYGKEEDIVWMQKSLV